MFLRRACVFKNERRRGIMNVRGSSLLKLDQHYNVNELVTLHFWAQDRGTRGYDLAKSPHKASIC